MQNWNRRIVAGVFLGGLLFALSFFIIAKRMLPFALVSAGIGFITGAVMARGKKSELGVLIADGITKADFDAGMKDAWTKQRMLTNDAFKITNPSQRKKVDQIAEAVAKILNNIKQDPKDYKTSRQFLEYYLDATVKIVRRYVELSQAASNPEIAESLLKVEDTLDSIIKAFEKQLRLLLENDKMDLDIELTVLKRTIEMEGLGPEPGETHKEE